MPRTRRCCSSVSEQADTLQRMLYEAGIAPDQLELLSEDAANDSRLRVELWTLAHELQWQLRSTANQLRRRWGARDSAASAGARGLARAGRGPGARRLIGRNRAARRRA